MYIHVCYFKFCFPSMPSKNLQHIEVQKYPVDVDFTKHVKGVISPKTCEQMKYKMSF